MSEKEKLQKAIKCAARALMKLAQQNRDQAIKIARHEAYEKALSVAKRLADNGVIAHADVLTKAATLAKEDLQVVEKALDLNLRSILDIGSAAVTKKASDSSCKNPNGEARKGFEDFLIDNYG